ncbi:MAG: protein translocase subunit SecD [Gemmataceae bacterium]
MSRYLAGDSGGFKLGTDLVGGTNLVYEIDKRKTAEDAPEGKEKTTDVGVLAEALKRRIDPNDLYNITIRPAGGENRVEIVLPTGGTYRAEKAEKAWRKVVDDVTKKYEVEGVDVPRGRTLELVDRIQIAKSQKIWDEKLFSNPQTFKRAKEYSINYWAELDPNVGNAERKKELAEGWKKLEDSKNERLKNFTQFLRKELSPFDVNDKSIDIFVKKLAWNELIERVKANPDWKNLNLPKEELAKIAPDATEQLIALIQGRGTPLGLAGITIIEQVLGTGIFPKDEDNIDRETILAFVNENYGPSGNEILRDISKASGVSGSESKDLTVEEVQRIKDLVSKVGSLEFRILANGKDDKDAVAEAESYINTKVDQEELKKLAEAGLPPPTVMDPNEPNKKKVYPVNLARNEKSQVSYAWVELGPQERAQLNLSNASKNDPARNRLWLEADRKRGKATQLPDPYVQAGNKFILNGALFYSRPCLDRNLPEEERRAKSIEYFVLARDPELGQDGKPTPTISGKYLVSAFPSPDSNGRMVVSFTFDSTGGDLFGNLTGKNVPTGDGPEKIMRHLAIVLDGLVMSAPTINSQIRQSGQITGNFTQKETENLVNILRAGRLPATLKPQPVSETTMGPTLGEDTIRKGVSSVLFAFLGVLIFMIIYYRFAGLVASIALIANLLLTVGFMVAVQATFTLPGLAGLVLTLGMAVDANVLIYERLREERERGASLILALRNGYDHALPTIIDTHLSSIFTAIVLYIVGNDQLKGFGVSLTVGLVISLFTSLYMTRLMFDFWQHKGWLTKLSMMRLFAKPSVDFMAIRNAMFTITLVVSILGLVLFIARIPGVLNIDFVGGTAFGGELVKPLTTTELRDKVDEKHQAKSLKVASVKELDETRYQINYEGGETRVVSLANRPAGDTREAREADLKARAAQLPDVSVEQVFLAKGNSEGNKSANFVIRTSEKEAELVQASIDRLLTDEAGSSLLKRTFIKADPTTKREARFYFYEDKDQKTPAYASTNFVRSLLRQELKGQELPSYDLVGEGATKEDGRSQIVRFRFENDLKTEKQQKDVQAAVDQVVARFNERPQPDRLENFDSTLARETQFRAMYAILASWAAILLYLWFRFGSWTFGLAAVLCLVHDLCFTLGAVAVCHYLHGTFFGDLLLLDDFKIDLPAVAALLTLVGYSVNDTIVVFDRIREVRGKSPELTPKVINDSINQTLSRTVLASLTTFIVVLVLFIWGGPGVHLFAFVMVTGVLVGTYSSIYIASPLLLMLGEGVPQPSKFSTAIKPAPQPA